MEDLLASWRRTSTAKPSSRAATSGGSAGGGAAAARPAAWDAAVAAVLLLLPPAWPALRGALLAGAAVLARLPYSLAQAQARSAKSVEEKLPCTESRAGGMHTAALVKTSLAVCTGCVQKCVPGLAAAKGLVFAGKGGAEQCFRAACNYSVRRITQHVQPDHVPVSTVCYKLPLP